MKLLKKNRAFSFVEIMIAIGIFFIAILPMMSLFRRDMSTAEELKYETVAIFLAKRVLELVKTDAKDNFDSIVLPSELNKKRDIVNTSNQSAYFKDNYWLNISPDGIVNMNDNSSLNSKEKYKQFSKFKVRVQEKNYPESSPIVNSSGEILLKDIIVTIYYKVGSKNKKLKLSTLIAR